MLVKLLPDQVAQYWAGLKQAIQQALPPIVQGRPLEDVLNSILTALMEGSMYCWALCQGEGLDKSLQIKAVITATMTFDACSGARSFLVYTMTGLAPLSREDWIDCHEAAIKEAHMLGCTFMSCYTQNPAIIDTAKKFPGTEVWNYVYGPI
jgi:hypothetical protein